LLRGLWRVGVTIAGDHQVRELADALDLGRGGHGGHENPGRDAQPGYQREDREGRYALVRAYAEGKRPTGIPEEAAAILARHAPTAAVMSGFSRKFQRQSRQTPYPLEEIHQLGGMDNSSTC
jgi:hypothetical protein